MYILLAKFYSLAGLCQLLGYSNNTETETLPYVDMRSIYSGFLYNIPLFSLLSISCVSPSFFTE